jgi:hypothetical protein
MGVGREVLINDLPASDALYQASHLRIGIGLGTADVEYRVLVALPGLRIRVIPEERVLESARLDVGNTL